MFYGGVDDKCERRQGKAEKKLGPCTGHFWLDVLHGRSVSREWTGDLCECHKLREFLQLY